MLAPTIAWRPCSLSDFSGLSANGGLAPIRRKAKKPPVYDDAGGFFLWARLLKEKTQVA